MISVVDEISDGFRWLNAAQYIVFGGWADGVLVLRAFMLLLTVYCALAMFLNYKNKTIIAEKQLNPSAMSLVRGWSSLLHMM